MQAGEAPGSVYDSEFLLWSGWCFENERQHYNSLRSLNPLHEHIRNPMSRTDFYSTPLCDWWICPAWDHYPNRPPERSLIRGGASLIVRFKWISFHLTSSFDIFEICSVGIENSSATSLFSDQVSFKTLLSCIRRKPCSKSTFLPFLHSMLSIILLASSCKMWLSQLRNWKYVQNLALFFSK